MLDALRGGHSAGDTRSGLLDCDALIRAVIDHITPPTHQSPALMRETRSGGDSIYTTTVVPFRSFRILKAVFEESTGISLTSNHSLTSVLYKGNKLRSTD